MKLKSSKQIQRVRYSTVDKKLLGYIEFKELLGLRSDTDLRGYRVEFDGVWVDPPAGDFIFAEEPNFLCRHPKGTHMIKKEPALVFPCSVDEFRGFMSWACLIKMFSEDKLNKLANQKEDHPIEAKEKYLKAKELNRWAEELIRQNKKEIEQDNALKKQENKKYAEFIRQEEESKETPEGFRDKLLSERGLRKPDIEIQAAVLTKYPKLTNPHIGRLFPANPDNPLILKDSLVSRGRRIREEVMKHIGEKKAIALWQEKMTTQKRKKLFPKKEITKGK